MEITHPLEVGAKVKATKKSCPCRGARDIIVEGKIMKVINNHAGYFYYLSAGCTVKADAILEVL